VNCAEIAGDRPRQPAYEIFTNAGVKKGTSLKSGYLSAVGLSTVKMIADKHRHAA